MLHRRKKMWPQAQDEIRKLTPAISLRHALQGGHYIVIVAGTPTMITKSYLNSHITVKFLNSILRTRLR